MATPETNAYETTARDEGRAASNGGSVPRCKLERAVERPAVGIQRSSRKSRDETRDEREPGWHRARGERASMTRRPPSTALSINLQSGGTETRMAGMLWDGNQGWHPGEPSVKEREMLLGRSEGSSHPTLIHDSETGGFPPPVLFQESGKAKNTRRQKGPPLGGLFPFEHARRARRSRLRTRLSGGISMRARAMAKPATYIQSHVVASRVAPAARHLMRSGRTIFWSDPVSHLLDINDLAELLGRSPETIKKDIKRNPLAVPPRLHIPGTRLLRWRQQDVDAWLAQFVVGGAQ